MSATPRPPAPGIGGAQRKIEFRYSDRELAGSIIDWCYSLPYRKIKEIRVHKHSKPPSPSFFVVVVLEDGSNYRLQRLQQDRGPIPNIKDHHDIIEIISPTEPSQRLITVTFAPDRHTDFLFVLTVCHGIQCVTSELKQMVFANDEFFAYALLSNVVRHALCPKETRNDAETPLEILWKDVYSFVHRREFGFREKTIAAQTQTIVPLLLRTATKEKLTSSNLAFNDGPDRGGGNSDFTTKIASAVAWVETLASRNEPFQLSLWDQAWDYQWERTWNSRWSELERNGTRNSGANTGLKTLGSLGITTPRPTVDGGAPGRAAGRALVLVRPTIGTTSPDPTPAGSQSAGEPATQPAIIVESPTSEVHSNQAELMTARNTPAALRPGLHAHQGLVPYPEGGPIWTTTFEAAIVAGWVASWEKSRVQGMTTAQAAQSQEGRRVPRRSSTSTTSQSLGALQRTTRLARELSEAFSSSNLIPDFVRVGKRNSLAVPSVGTEAGNPARQTSTASPTETTPQDHQPDPRPPIQGHQQTASQKSTTQHSVRVARRALLGESRISQLRTSQDRAAKLRQRRERDLAKRNTRDTAARAMGSVQPKQDDLTTGAPVAWRHAVNMVNSPERNLHDRAEQEWVATVKPSGATILSIGGEEQQRRIKAIWKETFEETWEAAWTESWKCAWQRAWKYGWEQAKHKGIESGVDGVFKDAEAEEIKPLFGWESYQQVKTVIDTEATYLEVLGKMHSMCKEINHLHTRLQHSIPIAHEHIMVIKVDQSKKPWTKLIVELAEGTTTDTPSGLRTVTHHELQEIIEKQSEHRFQKTTLAHDAFTQGMAEVWEFVSQDQRPHQGSRSCATRGLLVAHNSLVTQIFRHDHHNV